MDKQIIKKDSNEFWHSLTQYVFRSDSDSDGKPEEIICDIIDITANGIPIDSDGCEMELVGMIPNKLC